jgi:2-amino-4-hydroxy-6-hydroxymethyldihydropteridine diphosphokinase
MGPLAEVAPEWVHPVCGGSAKDLAERAGVGRDARPLPH